jgi:2-polyprenyl-6-methoxyphenol hydroxylase-like FAD-dependent oxidoreductase
MPQWDFLDFLADKASRYPCFRLLRRVEVTDLVEESGRVVGVRARTSEGPVEIRANLVVGADGRHSVVRERAKLEPIASAPPMDVLWFRVSRPSRRDHAVFPVRARQRADLPTVVNTGRSPTSSASFTSEAAWHLHASDGTDDVGAGRPGPPEDDELFSSRA